MTIPKPIEDLLTQATRFSSDHAAPISELKLLHGSLTRLRNQYYDKLDNENFNWDDPKMGNPVLHDAKRKIDSTLTVLTNRLMSAAQEEAVSSRLADFDSGRLDDSSDLNQRRPASSADLFVRLGWNLFDAGRIGKVYEPSREGDGCLLSWNAEHVSNVESSIRRIDPFRCIDTNFEGLFGHRTYRFHRVLGGTLGIFRSARYRSSGATVDSRRLPTTGAKFKPNHHSEMVQ